ncbi:hypothetical protein DOE78_01115 [Bacillus sp. Y1]|nr:endospore germination permease [Bacillus sp. Y1]AYA74176.1 hypothetical protein DOE78_01115 [Bacillus sp. Y1]
MNQISPSQLSLMIANFILTGTLISLAQVMTQVSHQYTWLVPILVYMIVMGLILIVFRKSNNQSKNNNLQARSFTSRILNISIGLLLVGIYIRDLRAFIDYLRSYILPETPIEILSILVTLALLYVAASGLQAIARITVIQFITLTAMILSLPILLLNEIELPNLVPILTTGTFSNLSKSTFLMFPWIGEIVIFFLVLENITYKKHIKKAFIKGISHGILLLFILIFLNISVLGAGIVENVTYPNILTIQQINVTDFLDRLDLAIVIVWMPCLLSKMALSLYCIQRITNNLKLFQTNLHLTPVSLLLGILVVVLFENNIAHLRYAFLSWTTLGFALEMMIFSLFFLHQINKKREKKATEGGASYT